MHGAHDDDKLVVAQGHEDEAPAEVTRASTWTDELDERAVRRNMREHHGGGEGRAEREHRQHRGGSPIGEREGTLKVPYSMMAPRRRLVQRALACLLAHRAVAL